MAGAATAQPVPLDPLEFQVNSYTTGIQYQPALASQPNGSFIVAWSSDGSWGSDQTGESIQVRRVEPGTAAASQAELQVNTCLPGRDFRPRVASDASGSFVVVWEAGCSFGSDTKGGSVQARRFAPDTTPLDAIEFQVNTLTESIQRRPDVALQSGGDFIVVWEAAHSAGSDQDGGSIQARRFQADGTPLDAAEFQVNTMTVGGQFWPSVAASSDGGFIVAWSTYDEDSYGVAVRRFAADGSPLDPAEIPVNVWTTGDQAFADVAAAADRSFVVAWESWGSFGDDNSLASVQARRFEPDGSPSTSAEVQVNTITAWYQSRPSVVMDPAGNFTVAWVSSEPPLPGLGSNVTTKARRYARSGAAFDPVEFRLDTLPGGNEPSPPVVALTPDGDWAFAWTSLVSAGDDGSLTSIQARRFARPTIAVGTGQDPRGPACSLSDAIVAANTGSSKGDCPAGSGGARLQLPADAVLTFQAPTAGSSATPGVETPITIYGDGSTIERDGALACPGPADFRLFEVADGGYLSLWDLTLRNGCVPDEAGGAILAAGGAVRLDEVRISDHRAADGAGIALDGASLHAIDSTLERNVASGSGGGVATIGGIHSVELERSTLAHNSAGEGGALAMAAGGTLALFQSSLSANAATARGGAVWIAGSADGSTVELATLAGNSAPEGSALGWESGALGIHDSLVGDGSGSDACTSPAGTLVASGANLATDGSCGALAGGGIREVGKLGLGPLGDHGGAVATHLPLAGGPALDAAPACATSTGRLLTDDARGYPRPTDDDGDGEARCDLGAVERSPIFLDGLESGDTQRWTLAMTFKSPV